jgi:hypothetical protein
MQTFLPSPSFEMSALALDKARLGKQRVEAYQILRALEGKSKGWTNHPATKMWRGYERALRQYLRIMIFEWMARGYKYVAGAAAADAAIAAANVDSPHGAEDETALLVGQQGSGMRMQQRQV